MFQTSLRISAVTLFVTFMSGCISYHSDKDTISQDIPDKHVLTEIVPGETHSDFLVAEFGRPSAVLTTDDNSQIWQYENIDEQRTHFHFLVLFNVKVETDKTTLFNFEIEDDRIMSFWKEKQNS